MLSHEKSPRNLSSSTLADSRNSLSLSSSGWICWRLEAVGGTRRRKVQAEVEICWLRRGDGRAGNEIFRKFTENKNKFLKPGLVAGAALLVK